MLRTLRLSKSCNYLRRNIEWRAVYTRGITWEIKPRKRGETWNRVAKKFQSGQEKYQSAAQRASSSSCRVEVWKVSWRMDTLSYPVGSWISVTYLSVSPPILDKVETRQKFPIFYSRGPSFPEAAHPCLNTDLSPPSINSLGKHVTRGRLHPDTGRKLPKVQRIPGDLGSTARIALFRS